MRRILEIIGVMMSILGVSTADSELLWIPVSLIVIGFAIVYVAERSEL